MNGSLMVNLTISSTLTLPFPCISESCTEISYIFFTPLCGASKGFMKAFKATLCMLILRNDPH